MLRLRPYKPSDADTIARWITDEKTFYLWSAGRMGTFPMDGGKLDAYYSSLKDVTTYWQMTAVDEEDIPRGHLIMRYIDDNRQVLRLGNIIVDTTLRGKGYGRELLGIAADYAKYCAKADKITLGVFSNNPAARRCYDAFGFTEMNLAPDDITMPLTDGDETWKCVYLEKYL